MQSRSSTALLCFPSFIRDGVLENALARTIEVSKMEAHKVFFFDDPPTPVDHELVGQALLVKARCNSSDIV